MILYRPNSSLLRHTGGILIVMPLVCLLSCNSVSVERRGASQQFIVSRVYPADLQTLRAAILTRFGDKSRPLPLPFRSMGAIELKPPNYPPDWIATWSDRGGFLEPYQRIPASLRILDLLIEEPIGDTYWASEYSTTAGPTKFRCGFILHFAGDAPLATEVQVYEKVPEIWAGEHWEFLRHGIGIGKVHDIRLVEPTVKDRLDMLNLLGEIRRSVL
jgi:hypothetical protein